jgi:hypothetical protein
MGPAVHTVQLLPLVPAGIQECQAGCTETILPTLCLVTTLNWGRGKQVRETQRSQPNPGGGALIIGCLCLTLSTLRSTLGPLLQACLPP